MRGWLADRGRHRLALHPTTLGAATLGSDYSDGARQRHQPMNGVITVNSSDADQAAGLTTGPRLIQAPRSGRRTCLRQTRW